MASVRIPISEATGPSGHQEFFLNDPRAAWIVQSGFVDVFAVEADSGVRHYVTRVNAGEALFGSPSDRGVGIRLLACADPAAYLRPECTENVWILAYRWIERLREAAGVAEVLTLESVDTVNEAYGRIHDSLAQRIAAENEQELARLRRKAAVSNQRMNSALQALAEQGGIAGSAGPDALAAVINVLGNALGTELTLPPVVPSDRTLALNAIAHASRVRVRRVSLTGEWWRRDGGPVIGYRGGRPIALIPRGPGAYRLIDPMAGETIEVNGSIALSIEETAFVLYRPLPQGSVSAMELLRFCLHGCRIDILRLITGSVVTGALGLLLPVTTAFLFDTVVPASDAYQLWMLAAVLSASAFCSALFTFGSNIALSRIESRAGAALQLALWDRILRLPVRFFRGFNSTDLALRSLGIEQIRRILAGPALSTAMSSLFAVLQIPILIEFGGRLAIPALAMIASAVALSVSLGFWQMRRQRMLAEVKSRVSARVMQFLSGITKVRVAGAESRVFALWADGYRTQRDALRRTRKVESYMSVLHAVLPIAGTAVVIINAAQFVGSSGSTNLGAFLAFSAAFHQLLSAAMQLGSSVVVLAGVTPLFERIRPILAHGVEAAAGADPGHLTGAIEARGVTFRYHPNAPIVLTDISFRIGAGEFIAFVGASGSGKSTLLRLLLGFEAPESGSIQYDGTESSMLNTDAVRRQIGAVLQDGRILPGDIATNILGSSGLGMEAAWEAARAAGLAEDIQAMPMGMHTRLTGSASLSGGQRQRLLIARALVAKPRILMFDEATSALDNRTQAEVSGAIEELDATRIVIAHRLSTIRNADRIYVLESGRVVESGKFQDLVQRGGVFARLAQRQMV